VRLILQEFLSLDGVAQGPGSPEEDTSDGFTQGGWLVPHLDDAFMRIVTGWLGEVNKLMRQPGRELQIHGSALVGGCS
jgi:hypothetical protein